jgi:restriction endonuclease S subunit
MKWSSVKLREVAKLEWGNTSITKSSYVDDGFPAFSATGNDGYVSHAEFDEDGIVLSAIGARCGKCFKAKGKWTAIKNTITIIPDKEKVDLNYLFVQLNNERGWKISGAAQPFITLGTVRDRLILLPPLLEQKRVTALLDTAENILRLREKSFEKLDELAMSVFQSYFENSAEFCKISDIYRINENKFEYKLSDDEEVDFIPMASVSETSKKVEIAQRRLYKEVKKGYTPIKQGDVIVAKITPCYENGKMALVSNINNVAFGSTEFHTFRNDDEKYAIYLYYFLRQDSVRAVGEKNMKGAAGQKRVPADFFSSLKIPKPKIEDLQKFSDFAKEIEKQKQVINASVKRSRELVASLQHQSFAVN